VDEPPLRTIARWRAVALDDDRLWIARVGETRPLARGNNETLPSSTAALK
jgi:hypothetical protein